MSNKKSKKRKKILAAAPSETSGAFDDPRDIQDAEELEESGGFSGEDDPDAEAVGSGGSGSSGLTASQLADCLLRESGEYFRFLTDRKVVFAFQNGIWQPDTGDKHNLTHELFKKARRLCLRTYEESGAPHDEKAHLRSAHMPTAVVKIAQRIPSSIDSSM